MKTALLNADFVLEGYIDPTEPLRDEGPYGEHTGYYTLPEPHPVFHVTATHTARTPSIPPPRIKLFLPIFMVLESVTKAPLQMQTLQAEGAAHGRCPFAGGLELNA